MRKYLEAEEPRLARLVYRFVSSKKGVRYADLRESIINGSVDNATIVGWFEEYKAFVDNYLVGIWHDAIDTSASELSRKYPGYTFDPFAVGVKDWIKTRSGDLITNLVDSERLGINEMIRCAVDAGNLTVDELARAIRPMVGLTRPQMRANMNYYQSLLNNGLPVKQAEDKALKYTGRQHRYRADVIARNEWAVAFRAGAKIGIQNAMNKGYMGHTVKSWISARDSRVCPICKALDRDGRKVDFNLPFAVESGRYAGFSCTDKGGAHIGCRWPKTKG